MGRACGPRLAIGGTARPALDQVALQIAQGRAEIVEVMQRMEPAFHGHSRLINVFALTRSLAGMIGPASKESRDQFLTELVPMLQRILAAMDEFMRPPQPDDTRQ